MAHYSKVDRSRFLTFLSHVRGVDLERYESYRTISVDEDDCVDLVDEKYKYGAGPGDTPRSSDVQQVVACAL